MKFKLNSIIVDAIQWDLSSNALFNMEKMAYPNSERIKYSRTTGVLILVSQSGSNTVNNTDWIIKGGTGVLFVVSSDVFKLLCMKA